MSKAGQCPCSENLSWWAPHGDTSSSRSVSLHSWTNDCCQTRCDTATVTWQVLWCSSVHLPFQFWGEGNHLLKTRGSTGGFAQCDLGTGSLSFLLFLPKISSSSSGWCLPAVKSPQVQACTYKRLFHSQNHWHKAQRRGDRSSEDKEVEADIWLFFFYSKL